MRTLQAIAVMLCVGPFASSPAPATGNDRIGNGDHATIVAGWLPGGTTTGSTTVSRDPVIRVAAGCPPGYVREYRYYKCVPDQRQSHPVSTPGAEQLPQATLDPGAAAQTCAAKGLMFAGDITTATHGGTCMCPPGLRSDAINNWASSRNQCHFP